MGLFARAGQRIDKYVNLTAHAAYLHPMLRYGFRISEARKLKASAKAYYFGKGLAYSLRDNLFPANSADFSQLKEALQTADSGKGPAAVPIQVSSNGIRPASNGISCAMLIGEDGGRLSEVSNTILDRVYNTMIGDHIILSIEEVAENSGYGIKIVADALMRMESQPLEGRHRVAITEGRFVYLEGRVRKKESDEVDEDLRGKQLRAAKQRIDARSGSFYKLIAKKEGEIKGLSDKSSIHMVLSKVDENKKDLGLRHMDIFVREADGSFSLQHVDVLEGLTVPDALQESINAGEKSSYCIELSGSTKEIIRNAGLNLRVSKALDKFFESLRDKQIEELIITKAISEDKSTQAIMIFSNPLFFMEEKEDGISQLNRLGEAVGKKLGKIIGERTGSFGAAQKGHSGIPAFGSKDRQKWVDRNQLIMSKFYDKSTKIFSFICDLSRAYQMSVLDGIARVFKDLKETLSKDEEVRMLDAGVGTAYFLERFLNQAKDEGIKVEATAIDLSLAACDMAREACEESGHQVTVKQGNIAKMTTGLADESKIEAGSQKLVFLNYVLQYVPIPEVLRETNRVLAMGGRALITNFKPNHTMSRDEFWTSLRSSWQAGKEQKNGHGRLYEIGRFFGKLIWGLRFIKVIKFANEIDENVKKGNIPPNPTPDELRALLEEYGFKVLSSDETHHQAAYQFYVEKISDLPEQSSAA